MSSSEMLLQSIVYYPRFACMGEAIIGSARHRSRAAAQQEEAEEYRDGDSENPQQHPPNRASLFRHSLHVLHSSRPGILSQRTAN